MTLLTLGGDDKTACFSAERYITYADGTQRKHGPISWAFGQALLNTAPHAQWSEILHEMVRLLHAQELPLPFVFHGQPTRAFGVQPTAAAEAGGATP